MEIQTKYNFGDTVTFEQKKKKIRGVHIYVSKNGVQTERYFFGNDEWLTLKIKK